MKKSELKKIIREVIEESAGINLSTKDMMKIPEKYVSTSGAEWGITKEKTGYTSGKLPKVITVDGVKYEYYGSGKDGWAYAVPKKTYWDEKTGKETPTKKIKIYRNDNMLKKAISGYWK